MNHQTRHFYDFGPYRLDAGERRLLRDGETVRSRLRLSTCCRCWSRTAVTCSRRRNC